jgi:hypothetical protein
MTRRRLVWIARIAITILFVYIANRTLTEADFGSLVRFIRPSHIVVSFVIGCAGLYCQIKRWQIILRYQKLCSSFYVASKTIFLGSLLAFITPGRLGELFRGLALSKERRADTVFAVVIDKAFNLLATFIIGITCACMQLFVLHIALPRRIIVLGSAAVAVCCAVGLVLALRRSLSEGGGAMRYAVHLINVSPKLFTRSGLQAILLSLAAHILLVCQTVVLIRMFGCGGMLKSCVAAGQAYAFMVFMPVFIANMGIREYSFAIFLSAVGAACLRGVTVQSAALGASMGILFFNLILPALAGLIWNVADTSYEQP